MWLILTQWDEAANFREYDVFKKYSQPAQRMVAVLRLKPIGDGGSKPLKALGNTKIKNAKASRENDRIDIMKLVKASNGMLVLNVKVINCYENSWCMRF